VIFVGRPLKTNFIFCQIPLLFFKIQQTEYIISQKSEKVSPEEVAEGWLMVYTLDALTVNDPLETHRRHSVGGCRSGRTGVLGTFAAAASSSVQRSGLTTDQIA